MSRQSARSAVGGKSPSLAANNGWIKLAIQESALCRKQTMCPRRTLRSDSLDLSSCNGGIGEEITDGRNSEILLGLVGPDDIAAWRMVLVF